MNALSGSLNMSVLICSASRPLQQSLEALLGAMGCRVVTAADTEAAAREQLSLQHHDLMLVDDSFDGNNEMLSAMPVPSLRLSSRAADRDVALTKPFRPADLAAKMQACAQCLPGDALAISS